MDYKLAKQLKDSGFPQIPQNDYYEDGDDSITIPTPEELIDACGEEFLRVEYSPSAEVKWEARDQDHNIVGGKTLTEAVAKLWFYLNKDK